MLLTGLAGEENTQNLYEFVSGEEVGTLRERNGIVKGIEQGLNKILNYVGDTFTGKKLGNEILVENETVEIERDYFSMALITTGTVAHP